MTRFQLPPANASSPQSSLIPPHELIDIRTHTSACENGAKTARDPRNDRSQHPTFDSLMDPRVWISNGIESQNWNGHADTSLSRPSGRHLNRQGSSFGPRTRLSSKSFDFGVKLDPPTKLIENFLQKQAASGDLCLDVDIEMMEKLCAVTEETNLCPLTEHSDSNGAITQRPCTGSEIAKYDVDESSRTNSSPSLRSNASTSSPREQRGVSFNPAQVLKSAQGEQNTSALSSGGTSMVRPDTKILQKPAANLSDDNYGSDSSDDQADVRRSKSILPSLNRIQTRSRLAAPPPQAGGARFVPTSAQLRSGQIRSGMQEKAGLLGEEEDDPFKDADIPESLRNSRWSCICIVEWIAFFLVMGGLICTLTVPVLKKWKLWSMDLWKWALIVLLMLCGRLVSGWIIQILVLILERNFLLRKRVLYFVYGLRKGVQNFIWFTFALLTWRLVVDPKVESTANSKVLSYVTKVLSCFLLAAFIWLIKIFLVKVLASSFHVSTYFERIRESLFSQWVLETLSGPPVIEMEEETKFMKEMEELRKAGAKGPDMGRLMRSGRVEKSGNVSDRSNKKLVMETAKSGKLMKGGKTMERKPANGEQEEGIRVDELHRLNEKNVSAWNMKRMMNMVRCKGISPLANVIDESAAATKVDSDENLEIQSEYQAKVAAKKIFKNVAKPGARYIVKDDLFRFMHQAEVDKAMDLFEGASTDNKITKNALKDFTVHVFRERRALALSLNDTKTAVKKLHSIIDVIISVVILIICLLILGITTTHFLLLISSQLVLVVFIFGNTCKTVFEAIIFLFVMHPFDVGDRCVVDGNQVLVEEMNILSTLFMRNDGEKIWYPNSLLATKSIFNYYRTPDTGDTFDFSIHASTPVEKIVTLKQKIGKYVGSKPSQWTWDYNLIVKEIEDNNRMQMQLMVNHTINYHDILERQIRRSDLILEVQKMLQELEIGYRLLPQEVHFGSGSEVEDAGIHLKAS